MLGRFASLRAKVLLIMGMAALVGLIGMFFVVDTVEQTMSQRTLVFHLHRSAQVFENLVAQHADRKQLEAAGQVLLLERVTIEGVPGGTLVLGHGRGGPGSLTVRSGLPGGGVVAVTGRPETATGFALEITAVAAALLALMLATGLAVARVLTGSVTGPVEQAVRAADRGAGGDLSARMGDVGPPELRRLATAFDGMAARLEEADHLQRRFLGDLAHEIATPLNAVTGFAIGLAEGTITSPEGRQEAAELVQAESQRLHDLLEALRRLHQLDLAEPLEHVELDAAGVAADVVHRLEPLARSAGVQLVSRGHSATLVGDPRLVEMATENLISNAIRYTPEGGRVEVVAGPRGDQVEIKVRDNGIGIDPEHLERIFDRLYRVDEARSRATGGFGIGLALVRRAALALGGHVEVDSQPGRGSEFRLLIPGPDGDGHQLPPNGRLVAGRGNAGSGDARATPPAPGEAARPS